ncbi:hypothetical protein PMIT1323_01582 [Prochlorococcus marinus str. MIT 1323]|nr:hypothetical protein PMIT1323_01582 [Prochlorococcus marinus str. MIT 1323]
MLTGTAISIGIIIFGILLNPFNFHSNLTLLEKSSVLFKSLIILFSALLFRLAVLQSIASLAQTSLMEEVLEQILIELSSSSLFFKIPLSSRS